MRTALILAGHGSHISPNTAGLVWEYVDMLRAQGIADEITACFWKEMPHFNQVLQTVTAERVIVVPLFTAAGFFSQEVIPAEMGLTDQVTQRGYQTIILTDPIGTHPKIADVVTRRITDTLQQNKLNPAEVAVAVIGHGTPRNSDSRNTTQQQVTLLQNQNLVATVLDAYLDDEPNISSIYERTVESNLIAVPFFLAIGSHVLIDVPNALGIDPNQAISEVHGKKVFYTPPVGTADVICDLILELAYSAGLPTATEGNATSTWSGFPQAGQAEFTANLLDQQVLEIGELRVTAYCVEPKRNSANPQIITTPAELRQFVRENKITPSVAGATSPPNMGETVEQSISGSLSMHGEGWGGVANDDAFRPLTTRTDLPVGWQVQLDKPEDAFAVIETIYPGVLADWARWRQGQFVAETLAEVSQRQVGMFQNIDNLTEPIIERTIQTLCGACIRQPTWFTAPTITATTTEFIPCATPCNMWLSHAVRGVKQ